MASEHHPPVSVDDDWAAQQADRVVDMVDTLKRQTTERVVVWARTLVFGLVILVLAVASAVLLVIALVRLADAYLPIGNGVGDATWLAHLFVGSLLSILGLGAWGSRRSEGIAPKPLVLAGVIDFLIVVAVVSYGIISGLT